MGRRRDRPKQSPAAEPFLARGEPPQWDAEPPSRIDSSGRVTSCFAEEITVSPAKAGAQGRRSCAGCRIPAGAGMTVCRARGVIPVKAVMLQRWAEVLALRLLVAP